jgi:tetratricopeptide (TPR) repeat protein
MTKSEAITQGWQSYQTGAFAQAEQLCRQLLQSDPRCVDAWLLLGSSCQAQQKNSDAVSAYQQAIQLQPDFAETHYRLGNTWVNMGRFADATPCYQQALRLRPHHPETLNNLGVVLAEQKMFPEAVAHYHQALQIKPDYPEAHYNLGNALKHLDRLDEAEAAYRQALHYNPAFAEAHLNLGIVLAARGKPDEAAASYQQARALRPDSALAHNNLGLALSHQNQYDAALACYARALQLQPDFADAHYNRALTLLVQGNFEQGWAEYEWRWKLAEVPPRPLPKPRWDGSPVAGKSILIHTEQGFGDTIQFIRFARLVKQRGATVLVECRPALLPLLRTCAGIDQWIPRSSPLPDFDFHAPLLSLPAVFQTTLATIPAEVPYLIADPALVEQWQRRLQTIREFKIGISWQGSPGYRWDRQRSFALTHFEPIARLVGVQLFSLQKGLGIEQLAAVSDAFAVTDLGSKLDENTGAFVETAAVMQNLDLVITCDTSIGHLAGALGVPVWIVLPFAPEWRWLLDREDSPWYPSARLFRQTTLNNWADVFARITEELKKKCSTSSRTKKITVEIAPGELLDKITILQIKTERITDESKLQNVRKELALLDQVRNRVFDNIENLTPLIQQLKAVNEALWQIEDHLRACERQSDFGPRFIELARSVYRQNDRRCAIKRQINELLGSGIVEEKSYDDY